MWILWNKVVFEDWPNVWKIVQEKNNLKKKIVSVNVFFFFCCIEFLYVTCLVHFYKTLLASIQENKPLLKLLDGDII